MPAGRGTKKSSKKGQGKRKPKAKKPAETQQEPQTMMNGIIIQLVPGEQEGNQRMDVQAVGETKVTEVPSLLKLAAKQVEEQLGIN